VVAGAFSAEELALKEGEVILGYRVKTLRVGGIGESWI
jgi:hypothetical protein